MTREATTAAEYSISEEQVQFYEKNGYIQLLNVLTPEELTQARAAVEHAMAEQLDQSHDLTGDAEYRKVFVQKVNLWRVFSEVRAYVFSQKLATIARQLTRAKQIRLWHDHVLVKMPGDSKASAWHQDSPYWPMQENGSLSCWMALDDVFEENGCMAFVPGTQKLGRLQPINLIQPQDLFSLVPDTANRGIALDPVFQPMSAGSCTFHDGCTFHYAGPNTTDKPRRAIITIYMPDEVHFNGAKHIVTDSLPLQAGDVLAGEHFPLLAKG